MTHLALSSPPDAPPPHARFARYLRASTSPASTGSLTVSRVSSQGYSLAAGGLSVDASLQGARAVAAEQADGLTFYRGAGPHDAELVHRQGHGTFEDFLVLQAPLPEPVVRYSLRTTAAGLRLVADTLELLDAQGTPQLRVTRPYLIDADGHRHDASLAVEGCAVDTRSELPWRRPVTPPGNDTCTLRVSWDDHAVRYPALLDPSWEQTSFMGTSRLQPVLVPLLGGQTMVVGGLTDKALTPTVLSAVEVFDPDTKTFSPLPPLLSPRHGHTATRLPSGDVMVAGGFSDASASAALASIEIYHREGDVWSLVPTPPAMGTARAFHTATPLPDGRVFVAGGTTGAGETATVEVFDPFAKDGQGKWNGLASMTDKPGSQPFPRSHHTTTLLADGRLLVAGGMQTGGAVDSALLFDPAKPSGSAWSATKDMKKARAGHTAVRMRSGQVVLAEGCGDKPSLTCTLLDTLDVFTPSTGSWSSLPDATTDLRGRAIVGLSNGWLLAAGGAETYVPDPPKPPPPEPEPPPYLTPTNQAYSLRPKDGDVSSSVLTWAWQPPENLATFSAFSGATVDARGSVLLAGTLKNKVAQPSAQYLAYRANGEKCDAGALECASGVCAESGSLKVCCDRACTSPCASCFDADTKLGQNGICAPIVAKEGTLGCTTKVTQQTCLPGKQAVDEGLCQAGECVFHERDCGYYRCEEGTGCFESCDINNKSNCRADIPTVGCINLGDGFICTSQFDNGKPCTLLSQKSSECKSTYCERVDRDGNPICCAEPCSQADVCDDDLDGYTWYGCSENGAECKANKVSCNGFRCLKDGKKAFCTASCLPGDDNASSCATGYKCNDLKKCTLAKKAGEPCGEHDTCAQGQCTGGFCCNEECGGPCRSCSAALTGVPDGTCAPVKSGTKHPGYCLPNQEGDPDYGCGNTGTCDGQGQCTSYPTGTFCGALESRSCQDGMVLAATCQADQTCQPAEVKCEPNHRCVTASPAACTLPCQSAADCEPGFACYESGKCLPLPTPRDEDVSCYCAQTGRSTTGAPALLALAALAALALTRRASRRSCS